MHIKVFHIFEKGDDSMAVKTNEKDGKLVKGTSSEDTISNRGNNVTISGGDGNDYIDNSDSK